VTASRVVYVGGMGRSGSTLLERALAQVPGWCGLGEVVWLWDRGIRNDEQCGCGEVFSRCPFWSEVGRVAFGGWGQVDPDRLAFLRTRVDDVKFVPRLLLPTQLGRLEPELTEYVGYYERLYAAVREITGATVIVDSSKLTALAFILSHSAEVDLRLLHMVRDPRAVSYAWTKKVRRPEILDREVYMPTYNPAYMALLYAGHNLLLESLRLRGVPTARVRYEDFTDDPFGELRRAAALGNTNLDPKSLAGVEPGSLRLATVHTVAGNPSRFQTGEVAIRRDDAWRTQMPGGQRRLVTTLAAPLIWRYGYASRA
jgi:hypothetical protein